MSHSRMLETRRKKQRIRKQLAKAARRAKKLKMQGGMAVGGPSPQPAPSHESQRS